MKATQILMLLIPALLSVGCAKRRVNQFNGTSGYLQCIGPTGTFDVFLELAPNQPGLYALSFTRTSTGSGSDLMSVFLVDESGVGAALVKRKAFPSQAKTIAGYIGQQDIVSYPELAIAQYTNGAELQDIPEDRGNLCTMPPLQNDGSSP